MIKKIFSIVLLQFSLVIITKYLAQESNTFGYIGTIGPLKTELIIKLSISKDECVYEFEGTYFSKKVNRDLVLRAILKPCENETEDPDKKVTLTEYDGETVTGTMILSGIGEASCNGNWVSPNGKKKQVVHFVAIRDKDDGKNKKK